MKIWDILLAISLAAACGQANFLMSNSSSSSQTDDNKSSENGLPEESQEKDDPIDQSVAHS